MGSYNRITIALFLFICLVSVGRGKARGDGTVLQPIPSSSNTSSSIPSTSNASTPNASTPTASTPTASTPTASTPTASTPTPLTPTPLTPTPSAPTASTPSASTPTASTPTASTPTPLTPTPLTPTPSTPTPLTPTPLTPTPSTPTPSTPTPSTPTPSTSTPSTPTPSTPTPLTPTPLTPTPSTPTPLTPTPVTPTPSTSTLSTPTPLIPPGESEFITKIGTTIITEESSETTPTQKTLTGSTSAPDSTNGITQNAVWTTVSREAKSAALGVTIVHSGVTEDIGNGTGVDVSTGGEGFTTREVHVDVTSDGVDTTTGPLSGDLLAEETTVEDPTNRLTVITKEILTTSDHGITATLTTSEGQTTSSLLPETAERATTAPLQTSPLATSERSTTSLLHTSLPPTTPERATTAPLQTSPLTTSERSTTSLLHTSLPPTTPERTTTAPLQTSPLTTSERATTSVIHTSLPPTTPERATTAPLQTSPFTTSERVTTSLFHTSLPPATSERATTAPLQTSSAKNCQRGDLFLCMITTSTPTASTPTASTLTASEGETTSVLPPTTPERTTTTQQPTTASRAPTASPSTTHVAQTTAHDEIQESPEDDSMNWISWTDLTEEERENILTLSFNGIREEDWMKHYDLKFRQFLSNTLTSNTARVEPENIYYIIPTPLRRRNTLYVSILARYSSMKRSAQPSVPLNVIVGALNGTALKDALGLTEEPTIFEGIPDFILSTTQLPTTLPTTDLPITQSSEQTEPPIIQPSTTEPLITQPSKTRKPPQKIGFLSNPGLFISLVVIATVSIIIIIVGLIYLLCDRRRGRTGEYITNHTPRNSDLELGLDNPVMAENDKNVSNGNHLSSIKGDMESDMIVPYDNFTQEELMNYEVEDTHL